MARPRGYGAGTVLIAVSLAVLLATCAWFVSVRRGAYGSGGSSTSDPLPGPATGWGPPPQTPPPDTPKPGTGFGVRRLGTLPQASAVVKGRGNADLRYERRPHTGTVVRFTCSGCDLDTWLVEESRGWPYGGGALTHPAVYTYVSDTIDLQTSNGLLVKAPAAARWTVTLTPFDALPVATDASRSGDDVVAIRTSRALRLTCSTEVFAKTFARATGADEYDVGTVLQDDDPGSWTVSAPDGPVMIALVACAGSWTLVPA